MVLEDPHRGHDRLRLKDHEDPVVALAFSPGGDYLVSVDEGGAMVVTRSEDGAVVARGRPLAGPPGALAVSRGAATVAVASADGGRVYLLDRTRRRAFRPPLAGGRVDALALTPRGRSLLLGGPRGLALARDVGSGWSLARGWDQGPRVSYLAAATSDLGQQRAVGGGPGGTFTLQLDAADAPLRRRPMTRDAPTLLALSPDSHRVVVARRAGGMTRWSLVEPWGDALQTVRSRLVTPATFRAAALPSGSDQLLHAGAASVVVGGRARSRSLR